MLVSFQQNAWCHTVQSSLLLMWELHISHHTQEAASLKMVTVGHIFSLHIKINFQVEYHPHYKQPELLKFCQDQGILLQAYCSLGGSSDRRLLDDVTVGSIAKKLNRSPAQVLLCWALQQGVGEFCIAWHVDQGPTHF